VGAEADVELCRYQVHVSSSHAISSIPARPIEGRPSRTPTWRPGGLRRNPTTVTVSRAPFLITTAPKDGAPSRRPGLSSPARTLSVDRLLAVIEVQNAVAASRLELESVMRIVVERACALPNTSGAVIELAEGDEMVYRAAAGSAAGTVGLRLARKTSLSGRCVAEAKPLLSNDVTTDERVDRAACKRVGVASMVCVPLFHDGHAVGVLKLVSSRADSFSEEDVTMLTLFAGAIAAAMSRAVRYEAAHHASLHDKLTGLLNRRAFDERLAYEIDRYQRYRQPLSVAMLDLDGFKLANDRWGHPAGDAALREVARMLLASTRETDLCFRFGGDEFAILLPGTKEEDAQKAVKRVTSYIAAAGLCEGTIGVSAGVAGTLGDAHIDIVERADNLLYAEKRRKKNR
jgi:diguanylate cyclase (GGDEF)-like protein